jgi:hypothetical protein
MRLRWVGDSRDYVKWDCVFENASGFFVFYVPMLRRDIDGKCRHEEVQCYFDQGKSLDQFGRLFPGQFAVFDFCQKEYSTKDADDYFQSVVLRLSELQKEHKVLVFIDPDTGIEPASGAKNEHLRCADMRLVWKSLRPGSRLIIYQHASRTTDWKGRLKVRAGEILGIDPGLLREPYSDERLAMDVCFLVLEKPES